MTDTYRPASVIEPNWQVRFEDEWMLVDMVVETEAPDGGQRIWFYFSDRPATVVAKGDLVMSRPPVD
jgi:hypothetical protein